MSEKRKPTDTILLKKQGKQTLKLELFPSSLWGGHDNRYRLRVNGKWFKGNGVKYFTKTEVRNLLFRSINFGA